MVVMVVAGLADATNILFERSESLLSTGEIPRAQSALQGLEIFGGLGVLAGGSAGRGLRRARPILLQGGECLLSACQIARLESALERTIILRALLPGLLDIGLV